MPPGESGCGPRKAEAAPEAARINLDTSAYFWFIRAPEKKEPPTAENTESAEGRRPIWQGPACGGFRRCRKSSRGVTAAPPKRRRRDAPRWSPCPGPPRPKTQASVIPVHPFDPRQKKQFETGMKGMQGIKQLAQSLRFPLLLRPLSLYFFIFFSGKPLTAWGTPAAQSTF